MFQGAQEVLREHKPQILFFCETKMTRKQMIKKSNELSFPNCFTINRKRMGGGLAMLWSYEFTVEIKSYSCHHVHVVVHNEKRSYWICTGIYGHPELAQKQHMWNLLKRLATLSSLPWLYFGVSNEILNLNEKIWGNERQVSMITEFREALKECD